MEEKQNLPYPTVGEGKDERAANIIAPFYAGRKGELASVSQCLYQSVRLSASFKDFAAGVLERIAESDALHFQLFGKTLLALGVDPVLSCIPPKKKKWFDTSAVSTVHEPSAMVLETLMFKRQTAQSYVLAAKRVQNDDVQHLLLRIAMDERDHATALSELYKTLCK